MSDYLNMSRNELTDELKAVRAEYEHMRSMHLSLDMSRGKPGFDNMDLSEKMFDLVGNDTGFKNISGIDCRNYGGLDGLAELKNLFGEILGLNPDQIIVGGNSSLNMMFDTIAQAMTHGMGGEPWMKQGKLKFLCPVPGYDRHFAITEHFGFELIPVGMTENGPDMDEVEELIKDETVKGIWCVPKYQNPTGIVFSPETVRRFAALKPAAEDFRIFWDNAYCIHAFDGENAEIPDIISECEKAGNADLVYEFCSTSKITFPGAGISALAASPTNLIDIKSFLQFSTIGPDKLNQLRHARFFKNSAGLRAHMKKHAEILKPKFEAVYKTLKEELGGVGIADWTTPHGGYFLSFNTLPGCAKKVVEMCGEYGVKFTPAGASFPYGYDPEDKNIRLAPSFATVEEITQAIKVLCLCTKLAAIEKLMKERT